MSCKEYLSELLSIQCEHAYGTVQRLKDAEGLSDADRSFLVESQDVLIRLRDRFHVVEPTAVKLAIAEGHKENQT